MDVVDTPPPVAPAAGRARLAELWSEFKGDQDVGGPTLAAAFIERALVDEYRLSCIRSSPARGPLLPSLPRSYRPAAPRDAGLRVRGRVSATAPFVAGNLAQPLIPRRYVTSVRTLWKRPSAFQPVVVLLLALCLVVWFVATFGTVRKTDEGTATHVFELIMGAQAPVVAYFPITWLHRAPRQVAVVLVVQLCAARAALAPPPCSNLRMPGSRWERRRRHSWYGSSPRVCPNLRAWPKRNGPGCVSPP